MIPPNHGLCILSLLCLTWKPSPCLFLRWIVSFLLGLTYLPNLMRQPNTPSPPPRLFRSTVTWLSGLRRFLWRIGDMIIKTAVFFIPGEILTAQFKEPLVNHPVVMGPDGSHMSMDLLYSFLLGRVADMLQVAQLGNPDHPGLQKSSDHDLKVVCNMKLPVMTAYRFVKRFSPRPYMVGG